MKQIMLALLLSSAFGVQAQDVNGLWHVAGPGFELEKGSPALNPIHFKSFTANESQLKGYLNGFSIDPINATVISLPTPDGSYRQFRVWSSPAMEAPLAAEYPQITTYTAEAVDNHQVTAKLDYTEFGFHGMVFDGANSYLIDPYTGKADGSYIAYFRKDYSRPLGQRMACGVEDGLDPVRGQLYLNKSGVPDLENLVYGTTKKSYRLALAADSDYCVAVAGVSPTKAAVLSKMVTSMNRVNGVYEREVAVSMILIANEDTLIFNTTAGDPYTNNNGSTMLNQNQSTISARIGSANYDIGHVFSTGGGGIAQKGCVCQNSYKAQGVTGSPSPVGDSYDIDYVAHEMGHQYGGDHTFNGNTGSCAGNGVSTEAYEPGSGTTIMAYAGICGGGNDFQAHSDAYFHSASLEQITSYITTGGGQTCAVTSSSTNLNATVPAYAASYNIPTLTPFELTAPLATDATADTLTYCWEERDLGDFKSTLTNTHFSGPIFRSYYPTTSRTRVFPLISKIINNSIPISQGEKLPDTARSMSFRFTERDVYQGWGTFNFPTDAISLNVVNNHTAFAVTVPLPFVSWTGGTTENVSWTVAGTASAPISCANVDIYLSTDGGYTYPILVKANTPNDGSENIVVPNVPTTSARIKVKGTGNVFFNISTGDFTIVHSNVGVSTSVLDAQIKMSPVPAHDVLNIELPTAAGTMQMQIVNTLGQQVLSQSVTGKQNIAVSDLARGVYQVILRGTEGQLVVRKIVLQ